MRPLVLDTETTISNTIHDSDSRYPGNDFYTLIWGSHPNEINVEHRDSGFKRDPGDIFSGIDVVIGHNLPFDLGYIWGSSSWQGYIKNPDNTIWDTAQAEYLLSGQRHKFPSLGELQEKYLGTKSKDSRVSRLYKKGIGADAILKARYRCPRLYKIYDSYSRDDGVTTLKIFKAQYLKAREIGMLKTIQMHQKALLAICLMQNTGLQVDIENTENTLRDFKLKSVDYLKQATELVAPLWDKRIGDFNINSPKHKSAMLFGGTFQIPLRVDDGFYKNGKPKLKTIKQDVTITGFGLPKNLTKVSKILGRYGTGASVVDLIAKRSKNELAKEYCKLQKSAMKYGKMASTYLEPFLNYSIDGILYPRYNTVLTQTGRLSSSKPNMQNVPASGAMLKPIQGQLIAPEGFICVDIDFSQLEPYVTALITGDKALENDLRTGVCLHCRAVSWIPRMAEGKTYEEIYQLAVVDKNEDWVLKRKKAKAINFKRAYGGGAKGLAEAEDLEVSDVQAVFDSQDLCYPDVKEYNDRLYKSLPEGQQLSRRENFGFRDAKTRVFAGGIELLPVFTQEGRKTYVDNEFRHYGSHTTITGRKYTFEEVGRSDKYGRLRRGYSTTETKNYQIQGSAADVVNMACAELMNYVITNCDLKMVRQIHDAISFYVKKGTEHLHIPKLCGIMEDVPGMFKKYLGKDIGFPFKVEAKVGPNFADMENYHEQIKK